MGYPIQGGHESARTTSAGQISIVQQQWNTPRSLPAYIFRTHLGKSKQHSHANLHFFCSVIETMKLEIELNIADDVADKGELQERLRKEAILALFADRKIPAGQAARELGLRESRSWKF
jgi:hypothetical protein